MQATYPGADARTLEQAVATPIEQQMNGVDNMNYMESTNASNGIIQLTVDFDVAYQLRHRPDSFAAARFTGAEPVPAQVSTAG